MTEKQIVGILCGTAAASLLFMACYFSFTKPKNEGLALLSMTLPPESGAVLENSGSSASAEESSAAVVDLNRATLEELCALPGIGEATAQKIIAYREENDGFLTAEELMNVSGIGEKKYEALKEFITVDGGTDGDS